MNFEAVTRKEAVLRQLRQEIVSGVLEPGEELTEGAVAERFSVSVTPVREAITQLMSEGLVEREPNKRGRVAALTVKTARELTDLQGILTVAAMRRAAPRVDVESLDVLAVHLDDFAESLPRGDNERTRVALTSFIEGFIAAAHQEELGITLRQVLTRTMHRLQMFPVEPVIPLWVAGASRTAALLREQDVLGAASSWETTHDSVISALSGPE